MGKKAVRTIGKQISFYTNLVDRTKKSTITIPNPSRTFNQRTTNPTLIATFDRNRVFTRFEQNRFIEKKGTNWRGRRKSEWTTLELPEIIERYN
jgi:hypothetical protein